MVVTLFTALIALGLAAQADASGSPNISYSMDAQSSTLLGGQSTINMSSSSPAGEPYGYNLTYRAVLPAGTSYVAGSSSNSIEPEVLSNAPGAGQTTLLWKNVSDLPANSSNSFSFKAQIGPTAWPVGTSPGFSGGAYINCDPRFVPDFDAQGNPIQSGGGCGVETSYTGWDTGSDSTLITAIELTKSGGGSQLRGVHDHKFPYTLTLTNNSTLPTDSAQIDDWLPAGIEYLGCVDVDHTTDAPTNPGSPDEYPGSGSLLTGGSPSLSNCVDPALVETVNTDPDGAGPMPSGVYTHLRWTPAQL